MTVVLMTLPDDQKEHVRGLLFTPSLRYRQAVSLDFPPGTAQKTFYAILLDSYIP